MKRYQPHPKQIEFLSSEVDELFYGGSRGGGKSFCLAYDAAFKYRSGFGDGVKISIDYPEYTALLIRRNYVDIEKNFKPICDSLYLPAGAVWKEKKQCYVFPSGAVIHLAHMGTKAEVDKYIGGNYHYLGIEEANQFPEEWVEMLKGSIRSTNLELRPYKRYTSNPGGIGHLWLKKYFIDKCPPKQDGMKYNEEYDTEYPNLSTGDIYYNMEGESRLFIPAFVFDNPSIIDNNPQYVKYLKSIRDPVLKKMWLLGDWDVMGGVYFDEWNVLYHIIRKDEFKLDKEECRIYRGIDYGVTNPFACVFIAIYPNGDAVVFDEIYSSGLVPTDQARAILECGKKWKLDEEDIDLTICDPSMRTRNHEYLNEFVSVVDFYMQMGMKNIHFGNNDRVPGWQVIREYLHIPDYIEGDAGFGLPKLRVLEGLHLTETIPAAVRDKNKIEDIDTLCDDHDLDALRYVLKFIGTPYQKKDIVKPMGWRERLRKKGGKHVLYGDLAWCN